MDFVMHHFRSVSQKSQISYLMFWMNPKFLIPWWQKTHKKNLQGAGMLYRWRNGKFSEDSPFLLEQMCEKNYVISLSLLTIESSMGMYLEKI